MASNICRTLIANATARRTRPGEPSLTFLSGSLFSERFAPRYFCQSLADRFCSRSPLGLRCRHLCFFLLRVRARHQREHLCRRGRAMLNWLHPHRSGNIRGRRFLCHDCQHATVIFVRGMLSNVGPAFEKITGQSVLVFSPQCLGYGQE